jgi:protein-disulfide isomerase
VNFQAIHTGLNPAHWPVLGSPDAPTVLLEMFDYTCGSCQQMSHRIHAARQKYGSALAIIVLPVSLNGQHHATSQQLARLSLSVFVSDREQFENYHEWLLTGRTVEEAERYASQLIGADRLRAVMQSEPVGKYLQIVEQLYAKANRGTLPLMSSDRFTSRGLMQTDQQLFQTIEQYHNLRLTHVELAANGG